VLKACPKFEYFLHLIVHRYMTEYLSFLERPHPFDEVDRLLNRGFPGGLCWRIYSPAKHMSPEPFLIRVHHI
jgi:hypothetical protein